MMTKDWSIVVKHDDSGNVVIVLEYGSERLRDKAYKGLLRIMNMGDYTAYQIDPKSK